MRLGIDFGTTRTVVAAQENGNYPVCTFSWEGEVKEFIPTLARSKMESLHFGLGGCCIASTSRTRTSFAP